MRLLVLLAPVLAACAAPPDDTASFCPAYVRGQGGYTLWTSAGTILGAPAWEAPVDPCGRLPGVLGDVMFAPDDPTTPSRATVLVDNLGEGACTAQGEAPTIAFTCTGGHDPWQLVAVFDPAGIRVAVTAPPD